MDLPPYELAGLCILSWLHLGEPISNVAIIANRVAELFPSLQTDQLQEQVRQVFNTNTYMFLYIFEQPLDLRCLNYMLINEGNTLLNRTRGNGFNYHMYRPSLFSIIMEQGIDLRMVTETADFFFRLIFKMKIL